jgi:hypothetical protein
MLSAHSYAVMLPRQLGQVHVVRLVMMRAYHRAVVVSAAFADTLLGILDQSCWWN